MHHGESFHPSLVPSLLDWWTKRWGIAEEGSMNCMVYTYYIMLMAKCTCAWLHHPLKLLISIMFCRVPIQVDQNGFMLKLTCMLLGCYLPIHLLLTPLSSANEDRSVDCCWFTSLTTKYVTFYAWTNGLTRFSIFSLPIQLLLCANIIVKKCLTASIIKYTSGQ